LADAAHKRRSLRRDTYHHFAPVITRNRTHNHSEILQSIHQSARRGGGVSHFLGDCRHRQHFLLIEIREQKKLWEGNIARRELFAQMQNETTLHFQDDVRKSLGVGTDFRGFCERCFRVQSFLS